MAVAVRAFLETKFGPRGICRGGAEESSWLALHPSASEIPPPDDRAVESTIAYADYVYGRYGRFPAWTAPFRTVIGFQVCHVDAEFYRRFYRLAATG